MAHGHDDRQHAPIAPRVHRGRSGWLEHLFGWHNDGEVATPTADPRWSFHTSAASAAVLRQAPAGALVCGRRLFDLTHGRGGDHPMGVPVFVVTHSVPDGWPRYGAPFTFVSDGVEHAVDMARAIASANIAQQCLNTGLLDETRVDLVPVLLGEGIPFFAHPGCAPVTLEGPRVVEGTGLTHLRHRVRNHQARRTNLRRMAAREQDGCEPGDRVAGAPGITDCSAGGERFRRVPRPARR